jgi:hypothetical protein
MSIFVCGDRFRGRGRIGPFRAAEISEREIGFFLGHEVGVGSEGELGVLVPELIRDPSEALAGGEGGARVGVASAVELEGADAGLVGPASDSIPSSGEVSLVELRAGLGAEDPFRDLRP